MTNFLTTEELLAEIKRQKVTSDTKQIKNKKNKLKLNKKHFYGSIVILAVLHLVFMAIPLVFENSSIDILGYQYAIAVDKNQELDEEVIGQLVRIKPIDFNDIEIGQTVLIFGLYSNNYFWEVEVLEIDELNQSITATFDDIIRNEYDIDEIQGVTLGETNLIGAIYYTASSPRGFISMVLLHTIILYGIYYFMFQNKKNQIKKDNQNGK